MTVATNTPVMRTHHRWLVQIKGTIVVFLTLIAVFHITLTDDLLVVLDFLMNGITDAQPVVTQ